MICNIATIWRGFGVQTSSRRIYFHQKKSLKRAISLWRSPILFLVETHDIDFIVRNIDERFFFPYLEADNSGREKDDDDNEDDDDNDDDNDHEDDDKDKDDREQA